MTKLLKYFHFRCMGSRQSHRGNSRMENRASLLLPFERRRKTTFVHVALTAFAVLCLSATGWSQSTAARLTGRIIDSSGAVVPHARVTANDVGTNLSQTVSSDDSGVYSLVALPPG